MDSDGLARTRAQEIKLGLAALHRSAPSIGRRGTAWARGGSVFQDRHCRVQNGC